MLRWRPTCANGRRSRNGGVKGKPPSDRETRRESLLATCQCRSLFFLLHIDIGCVLANMSFVLDASVEEEQDTNTESVELGCCNWLMFERQERKKEEESLFHHDDTNKRKSPV